MVTTATPDREKEDGDMLAAPLEVSQQGQELRKVRASVPLTVWTVAAVSTCERFAFYGMIGPFRKSRQITLSVDVSIFLCRPDNVQSDPALTVRRKLYPEFASRSASAWCTWTW